MHCQQDEIQLEGHFICPAQKKCYFDHLSEPEITVLTLEKKREVFISLRANFAVEYKFVFEKD